MLDITARHSESIFLRVKRSEVLPGDVFFLFSDWSDFVDAALASGVKYDCDAEYFMPVPGRKTSLVYVVLSVGVQREKFSILSISKSAGVQIISVADVKDSAAYLWVLRDKRTS